MSSVVAAPIAVLTPKQKAAKRAAAPHRHFCLVGGSRSTKTFVFIHSLMLRASNFRETNHGVFRFRANAARASISLDTLPKVQRLFFPNVPIKEHRQDGFWSLPNGSRIWVGGLDDDDRVEKILGNEFLTLFFNECSQIPYSSIIVALTRLAQNAPGAKQRAYYDLNPVGKGHWSNQMFGAKVEPRSRNPYTNPEDYGRMFINPVDNPYLSPEYLNELQNLPERHRKRFFEGVYVDEVDGALWTYEVIERNRVEPMELDAILLMMKRIVVAVDPSGASDDSEEEGTSDAIGLVVCGLGHDGHGYVIEDATLTAGPATWGRAAVNLYKKYKADCIVAEKNFGGEMVRFVLNTADKNVPVRLVNASRGKTVRAEPVSALYEKGSVRHIGRLPDLEDQMAAWAMSGYTGEGSPDRTDAMVWGLSHLMLKLDGGGNLIEYYRQLNEADARKIAVSEAPKVEQIIGKTVEQAMQEEAALRIALANEAAARRIAAEQPQIKVKGKARGAKSSSPPPSTPPALPAVRKSSFYDVAEATGMSGAPEPTTPKTRPALIRVDDHTIKQSFVQGAKA